MLLLKVFKSLMEKIRNEVQMLSRAFSLMPWPSVLIIGLGMIILLIQMNATITTTP